MRIPAASQYLKCNFVLLELQTPCFPFSSVIFPQEVLASQELCNYMWILILHFKHPILLYSVSESFIRASFVMLSTSPAYQHFFYDLLFQWQLQRASFWDIHILKHESYSAWNVYLVKTRQEKNSWKNTIITEHGL